MIRKAFSPAFISSPILLYTCNIFYALAADGKTRRGQLHITVYYDFGAGNFSFFSSTSHASSDRRFP